jgi:hypothetical protein
MENLKELLQKMVSGAEEHRWNGIAPESVALIFKRSPEEGDQSHMGQQALVCNSYPIPQDDANDCGARFCEPTWQYIGLVFAYRHPEGTQFEAHPSPDVSDEKWISMMKAPVAGTGLRYQDKIACRLTGTSYEEYLALQKKEEGATSSKEPRSGPESSEGRMKNTTLVEMPKHNCALHGTPRMGFAPIDLDLMQAMFDRDASSLEVYAQIKVWIEADAAKDPNPIDTDIELFKAAMLTNIPFAIFCRQCREVICVIQPERMKDDDLQNRKIRR